MQYQLLALDVGEKARHHKDIWLLAYKLQPREAGVDLVEVRLRLVPAERQVVKLVRHRADQIFGRVFTASHHFQASERAAVVA